MIKQTESTIFVDLPGHESYKTVMKTITRGDQEKAQGMFHMGIHQVESDDKVVREGQEVDVDVKEQFLYTRIGILLISKWTFRRLVVASQPSLSYLKFAIRILIWISNELVRINASSGVVHTQSTDCMTWSTSSHLLLSNVSR